MSTRMDEEDWAHTLAVFEPAFRVADARPKMIVGSSRRAGLANSDSEISGFSA